GHRTRVGIVHRVVDGPALTERPADVPVAAVAVALEHETALARTDEYNRLRHRFNLQFDVVVDRFSLSWTARGRGTHRSRPDEFSPGGPSQGYAHSLTGTVPPRTMVVDGRPLPHHVARDGRPRPKARATPAGAHSPLLPDARI